VIVTHLFWKNICWRILSMIIQLELKEKLHYNPITGICVWKIKPNKNTPIGSNVGNISFGYIETQIKYKRYRLHRLIFLYMSGVYPADNVQVDHINHIRNDNRWCNLRLVTHQNNSKNMRLSLANTSGCCGVYWSKYHNRWKSRIKVNKKDLYLGVFKNKTDAIIARKMAEYEHGFHPNHGIK